MIADTWLIFKISKEKILLVFYEFHNQVIFIGKLTKYLLNDYGDLAKRRTNM